eukprot:TRINITY_DN67905_c6_g1_i1.p1 TRINITY_DN67905_c6_g1~~TRINITY_DN67905_c6_g1_i1.p1  ORF type:complete len:330 (+),score=46.02 TRINITY_DN67905_c6_g1_i1:150-992(+)
MPPPQTGMPPQQGYDQGYAQQQQPMPGTQMPNFLADPSNNMVMTMGMQYGTKVFRNTKDNFSRWLPLDGLRYYFKVNNNYVKNKIKLLVFPARHRFRRREAQSNSFAGPTDTVVDDYNYLPPVEDINAPDMYIPLMAFITYILLVGLFAGLGHTKATFTPEVLVTTASSCALLLFLEVAFIRLGSFLMAVPKAVYTLDVVCWTCYRYVGASLCLLLKPTMPGSMFIGLWMIFAVFHGYFLQQSLHSYWTSTGVGLSFQVTYFLYILAACQIPVFLWLLHF